MNCNQNVTVLRASSLRVVTASDEYKLKQWNAANKGCRSTSLGPAFGGPVNRLLQVSELFPFVNSISMLLMLLLYEAAYMS
jgi:hypothetical protein